MIEGSKIIQTKIKELPFFLNLHDFYMTFLWYFNLGTIFYIMYNTSFTFSILLLTKDGHLSGTY